MAEGSGGKFSSDEGSLAEVIGEVQSMQGTLQSKISNLNAVVDAIESAWQGEASKTYNETQRQANTYARKLHNQLMMMESALQASKDGFSQNEIDRVEDFKQVAATSPIDAFNGSGVTPTAR